MVLCTYALNYIVLSVLKDHKDIQIWAEAPKIPPDNVTLRKSEMVQILGRDENPKGSYKIFIL